MRSADRMLSAVRQEQANIKRRALCLRVGSESEFAAHSPQKLPQFRTVANDDRRKLLK